jgi:hypothetical protein
MPQSARKALNGRDPAPITLGELGASSLPSEYL